MIIRGLVIFSTHIHKFYFSAIKMSGKSSFSEDLIGEFQEAFMLFDTKGDGMIPVSKNYNDQAIYLNHKFTLKAKNIPVNLYFI